MNNSSVGTDVSSECVGLRILDIPYYHYCYNLLNNTAKAQCEIEYPCEVRQYLYSMAPFISITRGFLSYGTVFIILLGLFLNSLSFYTFISSGLSKSGSGIYLMSLAVCDIGNLITNYGVGVARGHIIKFNQYFMDDEWLCKAHAVCVDLFQLISAWIVVTFTVERCIAIWYPMLLRNSSRKKRARIVVSVLSFVLGLFSLSKLFLTGFEGDSVYGYPACTIPSKRYRWQGVAYVRVAFQTWIPTVAVFIFNILMFCKLQQLKTTRKQLTKYRPSSSRNHHEETTRKTSFITRPSKTAPMLIAVSLTYLILVLPVGIAQTFELVWDIHHKQPIYTGVDDGSGLSRHRYVEWKTAKILLKLIRSFCFGFYQINFAINFFLYFAAGLQFRLHLQHKVKEFLKFLGIKCKNWPVSNETSRKGNNGSMTASTIVQSSSKSSLNQILRSGSNIIVSTHIIASEVVRMNVLNSIKENPEEISNRNITNNTVGELSTIDNNVNCEISYE